MVGEIDAEGTVRIEGTVEGNVWADRVWLTAGGTVEGDILSREALLGGRVHGMVSAEERVEVQPGSVITGDITKPALKVLEGGQIDGRVRMKKPEIVKPGSKDRKTTPHGRPNLKAIDGGKERPKSKADVA